MQPGGTAQQRSNAVVAVSSVFVPSSLLPVPSRRSENVRYGQSEGCTNPLCYPHCAHTKMSPWLNRNTSQVMHRIQDHQPSLAYLKLMQEEWSHANKEIRQLDVGDQYDRALMHLVLLGWMERKPYDLSDLAESLGVSRQQVMRRVDLLDRRELITTERARNRVLVSPASKLIEFTASALPMRIERHGRRWAKVIELLHVNPLLDVAS